MKNIYNEKYFYDTAMTPKQNYFEFVSMFIDRKDYPSKEWSSYSPSYISEDEKKIGIKNNFLDFLLNNKATDKDYIKYIIYHGAMHDTLDWESMREVMIYDN